MSKFVLSVILVFSFLGLKAQVDNLDKNRETRERLEAKYQKELSEKPNSAEPHWNHANELAKVTFNASESAPEFYLKAISIDSMNPLIFRDLGTFLFEREIWGDAYFCFSRASELAPNEKLYKDKMEELIQIGKAEEEYWDLHAYPPYNAAEKSKPSMSYKERTDFFELEKKIQKGKFAYEKLAERFLKNPNDLTSEEMFYLNFGQSQQPHFMPYNFEDEKGIQKLTKEGNLDEAIKQGTNIIKSEILNIMVLRELLYCYRKKNDEANTKLTEAKLSKTFDGITFSGNGTCDEPFLIFSTQEEYSTAVYLGYRPIKLVSSSEVCSGQMTDKLLVETEEGQEKKLCFNYTVLYLWMSKAGKKGK